MATPNMGNELIAGCLKYALFGAAIVGALVGVGMLIG